MSIRPDLATLCAALLLQLPATSQMLVDDAATPRDGGLEWSDCTYPAQVDFEPLFTGPLSYTFVPSINTGNDLQLGNIWSWYDGNAGQDWGSVFYHTFPEPGEHLVCLSVFALDQITQQSCTTVTCQFVEALQDPSCAGLEPDFTISDVAGQTLTFSTLSVFGDSIVGLEWHFGDGGMAEGPSATHTFAGSGPYRICLRVTGVPPEECSAEVCKWLYLGPGDLPCAEVLTPGFVLLQFENIVGVLDSSHTTGMSRSLSWDFGDGTTAEGRLAVHNYVQPQEANVCLTVRTWGPLVNDTCQAIACESVPLATGMQPAGTATPIRAWPVPFAEQFFLEGLHHGPWEAELIDMLGRVVLKRRLAPDALRTIAAGHLPASPYVLRLRQGGESHVLRVLKE
jgi:hypothetical protein